MFGCCNTPLIYDPPGTERLVSFLIKLWAAPTAFALWADRVRSTWASSEFNTRGFILQLLAHMCSCSIPFNSRVPTQWARFTASGLMFSIFHTSWCFMAFSLSRLPVPVCISYFILIFAFIGYFNTVHQVSVCPRLYSDGCSRYFDLALVIRNP